MYILTKQNEQTEEPPEPDNDIPWYPAVQWENTPVTFDHEKPTHVMSVTTDAPAARIHVLDKNYVTLPEKCKEHVNVLRETDTELHEHHATVRGLNELRLAQNRDVHLLALRKLMKEEELDESIFLPDVQDFARRYFHQKKDLLFVNDILCVQYKPQQRPLHVRPCMIVLPQL